MQDKSYLLYVFKATLNQTLAHCLVPTANVQVHIGFQGRVLVGLGIEVRARAHDAFM